MSYGISRCNNCPMCEGIIPLNPVINDLHFKEMGLLTWKVKYTCGDCSMWRTVRITFFDDIQCSSWMPDVLTIIQNKNSRARHLMKFLQSWMTSRAVLVIPPFCVNITYIEVLPPLSLTIKYVWYFVFFHKWCCIISKSVAKFWQKSLWEHKPPPRQVWWCWCCWLLLVAVVVVVLRSNLWSSQFVTVSQFVTESVAICDECRNLWRKVSQFVTTSKYAI